MNRPASARCRTAATALAASTLTVAAGRSTAAIAVIASAGESTYSSTLWQMTRSAAFVPTRLSRLAASPCTAVSRAPASAARRCAAASASGLGSTTVTLCPRAANGTASPPVPPPTSTMSSACLPVSATRAETTSRSTSQTSEERTPSRLKSAATPASFQESNVALCYPPGDDPPGSPGTGGYPPPSPRPFGPRPRARYPGWLLSVSKK